ncbi:site-2 protease family protein [Hazenella coriacea]|uniref:Zn-dependent protease n=1 Tax=Hazenella coriacea TaxID=1179467 RepID=A0A4R3L7Q0_9BACL|nr:site-2 protease family protein [Hazenella coriacea]TCS94244.1 Zn-dependent protease [Hazenella coriacea]
MEEKQNTKPKRGALSRWGWLGVLLVSIGSKLKALLPLLKFGKFGGTIISMAVSVAGYTLIAPFEVAIGLVVMIFIHEMGHVWAAKMKGLPVSAPAFIPFLGALIMMKRQPQDASTEAFIAMGGPLLGTVGALIPFFLGIYTGDILFFTIASIGFFINLFNLVPIHPLDGGRIVVAITRWLWVLGLVVGLLLIIYLRSWLLLFIYVLFVIELWSTYRPNRKPKLRRFAIEAKVDPQQFEHAGMWIPGENHRRPLFWVHTCNVESQKESVKIEYPGLGTIVEMEGSFGTIREVYLTKTIHPTSQQPQVHMMIEGTSMVTKEQAVGGIQKDEKYYSVKPLTRWMYGISYVGLASFLVYMMFLTGTYLK